MTDKTGFEIRKAGRTGLWGIYTDVPGLADRIEDGDFGEEAAFAWDRLLDTKKEAEVVMARLAEIVIVEGPGRVPPVGVAENEGQFVIIMTYPAAKACCGHLDAKHINLLADYRYPSRPEALEAAGKIYDLIKADIR